MLYIYNMKTRFWTMSESKTTSDWNWEVMKDGEARRHALA